ncbi:hypothetical protein fugu_015763 [Takifugu bimaculatus]|uniref:G-protein coupled receptors family 3 profile domain-containing protein n=1 Tax=Takifugu bimaculatus TaxID=433685 RepID=A0A4Z2C0C4_9TELE|nr:hypothetical protein fugu_015763 [Takifugu bimaculatus]
MAGAPEGCGPGVTWVYYNMCDLVTAWGIVAETVAAAGVLACFLLFVILVASLPSVTDKKRKATVALQAGCAARRFLFGVLFAGCLACLMTHGLWLLLLGRRGRGPKSWVLCLGALALWLVEVIINTEWLIITLARGPADGVPVPDLPCSIANLDFVASLTYVMVLLLAVVLLAFPSLARKRWRRDAAFLLTTGISTMAIWVAWILMYTHGNQVVGNASWDDPTLAVAVVTNAWVFLFLYTIPEICLLTKEDPEEEEPQDLDHVYPPRSLIYDSVRKEAAAAQQSVYIENKAFSMEEPPAGPTKPVSPYGAYNGQVRGCVYQPTAIALIAKDGPRHKDPSSQNPNREPRKRRLPATLSRANGFLSLQWMRETGNPLQ